MINTYDDLRVEGITDPEEAIEKVGKIIMEGVRQQKKICEANGERYEPVYMYIPIEHMKDVHNWLKNNSLENDVCLADKGDYKQRSNASLVSVDIGKHNKLKK